MKNNGSHVREVRLDYDLFVLNSNGGLCLCMIPLLIAFAFALPVADDFARCLAADPKLRILSASPE
jgi:hypothetical protein